ncbi:MAG: tyrosine-type recombinase/integrase [Anaerolineae bacterium]
MYLISTAVNKFVQARLARGCTAGTAQNYASQLALFADWLAEQEIKWLDQVKLRHLEAYVADLRTRDLMRRSGKISPVTIQKRALALRSFFRWCHQVKLCKSDPARNLNVPKCGKRLPKALLPEMVDGLVAVEMSVRDCAILALFLDTGLRLAEVAALDLGDIDYRHCQAHVRHGKNDAERWVVFLPSTGALVKKWLRSRVALDQERALFVSVNGVRLSSSGLYKIIKRLAKAAGIYGEVSPHKLRHTFATGYLDEGGSLHVLSAQLGHTDIATTMIYVSVARRQARLDHAHYSPVRRLAKRLQRKRK